MTKLGLAAATLLALAACADPLAQVEKLSDVELADAAPTRGVIADPEVAAAEEVGLFGALFGRAGSVAAVDGAPEGVTAREADRAPKPRRARDLAQDVEFGVRVPFGQVGRLCGVSKSQLGKRIDKAGRGRGYALYDSDPSSTVPRSYYVTGFGDGCARQFTAALAMFGAPSMHEKLRYGRPSKAYPYSDTDKAYEKVKSSVCKVGRRTPCGKRIDELERNTVFVSTYERFGGNARWADILLHDGQVMAAAIKD